MKIALGLLLILASATSQAATVSDCKDLDSISMLVGNTKSFAKGAVRVAHISTEEPAVASDHILVFVYGDEMSLTCKSINAGPDKFGFGSIAFDKMTSSYNAADGLTLSLPAETWNESDNSYSAKTVVIKIDRRDSLAPVITAH